MNAKLIAADAAPESAGGRNDQKTQGACEPGLALESGEFIPASELNARVTNTASGAADDLTDAVSKALRRAWDLGQDFGRRIDTENYGDFGAKAIQEKFNALANETCAALASAPAQPAAAPAQAGEYPELPDLHSTGAPFWRAVFAWHDAHHGLEATNAADKLEMLVADLMHAYADAACAARGAAQAAPVDAAQYLASADLADLQRIEDLFDDGEGHDLPKARMVRLADLGAIRHHGGGYYSITAFGWLALGSSFSLLPLETVYEHNDRLGAENAANLNAARAQEQQP